MDHKSSDNESREAAWAVWAAKRDWKILLREKDLLHSKRVMLEVLKEQPWMLRFVSPALRDDREVVLVAVQTCGAVLADAGEACRADRKVVWAAIRERGQNLQYASASLRGDKNFLREIVAFRSGELRFASEALRSDRDVVLAAVKNSWKAISHASKSLQGDEEIALEILRQDQEAIMYVSEDLRAQKAFMLNAVQIQGLTLAHASDALRGDRDVVLAAIKHNWKAISHASKSLQGDEEIALELLRQDQEAILYVSEDLRAQKAFMFKAVQIQGLTLAHASEALKSDADIVQAAAKQNGDALCYASEDFPIDQDLVLLAARSTKTSSEVVALLMDKASIADARDFWPAVASPLAAPGEDGAPVLVVSVSRALCDAATGALAEEGAVACKMSGGSQQCQQDQDSNLVRGDFVCDVSLVSGASFTCRVQDVGSEDELGEERPGPILTGLASLLVQELPQHTEIKNAKCVFINFVTSTDGDVVAVSPFDWNRPLLDFLFVPDPLPS